MSSRIEVERKAFNDKNGTKHHHFNLLKICYNILWQKTKPETVFLKSIKKKWVFRPANSFCVFCHQHITTLIINYIFYLKKVEQGGKEENTYQFPFYFQEKSIFIENHRERKNTFVPYFYRTRIIITSL